MAATPEITQQVLNAHRSGFDAAMDFRFVRASRDQVVAEFTVAAQHLQPYGIVHGGVHCGIVETICSVGAALDALSRGQSAVGLENHTTFLRAVRAGTRLTATATPLTRGRRTQVWEARIADPDGRAVATGRVRVLCLDPGTDLGGEKIRGPEVG